MDLGDLYSGLNALDVAIVARDASGAIIGLREGSETVEMPAGPQGPEGPQGETGPAGPGGASVYGESYYCTNADSNIVGYETMGSSPTGAVSDETAVVDNTTGLVLIDQYVTPPGVPGVTTIAAGSWLFNYWSYVSSSAGITKLTFKVYMRSLAGVETLLFSTDTAEINATVLTALQHEYFTTNPVLVANTDRLVLKVYASTTHTASTTVHFYHDGSASSSHFHSPIASAGIVGAPIVVRDEVGKVTGLTQGGETLEIVRYALDGSSQIAGFATKDSVSDLYLGWDDLRFPAQGINPAGAVGAPTVDTATVPGTLLFSGSAVNLIAGIAQMPHSWLAGSAVRPHVHWAKTTSAAGGVEWEWCYAIAGAGEVLPAYSAWLPATVGVADSDTAGRHAISKFPELTMTGKKESTIIAWQVRRNPAAVGDTYATNARFFEFDIHYQMSKFGTIPEYPT